MDLLPSGGFTAAVFFGALVIWFHAWNQFNRPSYQESSDFTRVLRRLQPSDMRKGPVFLQAYIFYAVVLTFIYLLICIYASVPFLQGLVRIDIPGLDLLAGTAGAEKLPESGELATGAAFDEASLGAVASYGPSPSLPLLVSLAVVGLAPNVPFLARVEGWLRLRSHKLSGIPTHLIDSGFKLRRERMFDPEKGEGLLISDEEWRQVNLYYAAAEPFASREREALREQVLKIIAIRNWVLRGRVFQPDGSIRYRYQQLEAEVRQAVRDLLARLDALSVRTAATPPPDGPEETAERSLEWAGVVRDTEEVCGDICVLVALYSEREAFAADMREARSRRDDPSGAYEAEQREAGDVFTAALRRVSLVADRDSFGTTVFFRLGRLDRAYEHARRPVPRTGALRGRRRSRLARPRHEIRDRGSHHVRPAAVLRPRLPAGTAEARLLGEPDRGRRSRAVAQYCMTFFIATLIALVGLVANNIYFAIADVGLERVAEQFQAVLLAAYRIESPRAVMGGVLAIIIALIVDAWRAGKLVRWGAPWPVGLVAFAALALGGLGAWDRYQSLAAVEGAVLDQAKIMLAGASAAIVGLVAATYVLQSLMDEFEDGRSVRA